MTGIWGNAARRHWQRHLPTRYAALQDPDWFFADIDQQATAYYQAIRDAQLDSGEELGPGDGAVGVDAFDWANQVAREIVEHELIYIPGEDHDEDDDSDGDGETDW